MTSIAAQDIPVSLKCSGSTNISIPAGISTYFLNATHILLGCWVKPIRTFDGVNWQDFLVFRGDSGSSVFAGIFINNTSNNFAVAALGAGSAVYPATLNTWQHVVAEINIVTSTVRLWVDGVLVFNFAATFARNLATVTSVTSTLGDTSSPGFDGHIAEPFICNRTAAVTQDEIDDIYKKGVMPGSLYTFYWPIRKAATFTLECEDGSGRREFPQRNFNGTFVNINVYSRDTPSVARPADRVGGSCIFTSGATGLYRNTSTRLHTVLNRAPVVIASAWVKNINPNTGTPAYAVDVVTPGGSAAILIMKNNIRHIEFGARSVDGDAYQSITCFSSTHNGNSLQANEWLHLVGVYDFLNKTIEGYINGVLVCRNPGAAWAENSFQCTSGSEASYIGHPALFWPGFIDDVGIYRAATPPTLREVREFYLKGFTGAPVAWTPALLIDCNDFGPNLIDKSGNRIDFEPVNIAVPYGLSPLSYMP